MTAAARGLAVAIAASGGCALFAAAWTTGGIFALVLATAWLILLNAGAAAVRGGGAGVASTRVVMLVAIAAAAVAAAAAGITAIVRTASAGAFSASTTSLWGIHNLRTAVGVASFVTNAATATLLPVAAILVRADRPGWGWLQQPRRSWVGWLLGAALWMCLIAASVPRVTLLGAAMLFLGVLAVALWATGTSRAAFWRPIPLVAPPLLRAVRAYTAAAMLVAFAAGVKYGPDADAGAEGDTACSWGAAATVVGVVCTFRVPGAWTYYLAYAATVAAHVLAVLASGVLTGTDEPAAGSGATKAAALAAAGGIGEDVAVSLLHGDGGGGGGGSRGEGEAVAEAGAAAAGRARRGGGALSRDGIATAVQGAVASFGGFVLVCVAVLAWVVNSPSMLTGVALLWVCHCGLTHGAESRYDVPRAGVPRMIVYVAANMAITYGAALYAVFSLPRVFDPNDASFTPFPYNSPQVSDLFSGAARLIGTCTTGEPAAQLALQCIALLALAVYHRAVVTLPPAGRQATDDRTVSAWEASAAGVSESVGDVDTAVTSPSATPSGVTSILPADMLLTDEELSAARSRYWAVAAYVATAAATLVRVYAVLATLVVLYVLAMCESAVLPACPVTHVVIFRRFRLLHQHTVTR
jgi:hypothetical protein